MPAVVSIKNARKSFGEVEVLRDISLEVARGEVVAVIGPSGGGKSTLLRCMTPLETLDAGRLSYGEVDAAVPGEGGTSVYARATRSSVPGAGLAWCFRTTTCFRISR